ncbi:MAG: 5-formyltetrahydrofolate cyclo-ligase [Candidatus Melainabacteria bacterium]|jgi:5-formyltetrahydrofolate cyclo-ligase
MDQELQSKSLQKSELRAKAKQIFSSLNLKDLSLKLNSILSESDIWQNARSILCYSSLRDEIDLSETINLLRKANKNIFLPKVLSNSIDLSINPHSNPCAYTQLAHQLNELNGQAITESFKLEFDFSKLDLLFIPGLMFDEKGYRLGRGMGFYDRVLAQINPRAVTIGIIPSALIVPKLACIESFDLSVHYLFSEKGLQKVL